MLTENSSKKALKWTYTFSLGFEFWITPNLNLTKSSYVDCYYELAEKLDDNIQENKAVFKNVTLGMKIWSETINKIDR